MSDEELELEDLEPADDQAEGVVGGAGPEDEVQT
jgi:hypothetical protein